MVSPSPWNSFHLHNTKLSDALCHFNSFQFPGPNQLIFTKNMHSLFTASHQKGLRVLHFFVEPENQSVAHQKYTHSTRWTCPHFKQCLQPHLLFFSRDPKFIIWNSQGPKQQIKSVSAARVLVYTSCWNSKRYLHIKKKLDKRFIKETMLATNYRMKQVCRDRNTYTKKLDPFVQIFMQDLCSRPFCTQ